eukprot:gene7831-8028_t
MQQQQPVLAFFIGDPEPAWLTPDIKQRFLDANSGNVKAATQQAQRTHTWRQTWQVDSVLDRPCPQEPLFHQAFPTYTLLDENAEGHAVIYVPLEHVVALYNEYLVKVAAPKPLPAGGQVQIYDLSGFKLSFFNLQMFTLFKMLVRFISYYPGRAHASLVINAPAYFAYPWKLMSALLDEKIKQRINVVSSAQEVLPELIHHFGGLDNVPAAWGGSNTTALEFHPAHLRSLEFVAGLNAKQAAPQQPLPDDDLVNSSLLHHDDIDARIGSTMDGQHG